MKRTIVVNVLFLSLVTMNSIFCSKDTPVESDRTLAEELQAALDNVLEYHGGKGVSAAVMIPGEEIWLGVSGVSHESSSITSNMVFIAGSVTKSFTAALILQLADEGSLALDDSLYKWLPTYPNIDTTITIRQLLNHTSGIYNYSTHPTIWTTVALNLNKSWTPEEIIASFVLDPYFSPGSDFHYSNTGYTLLGMIIEAATRSEVSIQLRNRFLIPLGLSNTFLAGKETITENLAHGWYDLNNDGVLDDVSSIPGTAFYSIAWTAGAMVTSAEDLAKWSQALFKGNVLSQTSLDNMLTFYSPTYSDMYTGYGLGVGLLGPILVGETNAYGHAGDAIGYASLMIYLPEHGTSISLMLNEVNVDCLSSISNAFMTIMDDHFQ